MPLPEFAPRTFEEILQDMYNYIMIVAPELTDWNIGSRIRTISEASSLEDDEQYHQMVALLDLWNLLNVRGVDLDERLAEWNIARRGPLASSGSVIVSNTQLITSFLSASFLAADTAVSLYSTQGFPTTYPFTIRLGEDLTTVEDVNVTNNNQATGVLTLAAGLVNNHSINERVSLVDGGVYNITEGQRVRVPATDVTPERTATVLEASVVAAGNYDSPAIPAQMDSPGLAGNVAAGAVTEFVGSPPFDGAAVRNDAPFSGGRDTESDQQFLSRGRNKNRSLTRGTPLSLEQLTTGIEYTDTSDRTWRIISAKLKEFRRPNQPEDYNLLYIWPGSFDFILSSNTTVESVTTAAEDGQKFFQLANTAIVPNSLILQRKPAGGTTWETLVLGTDYYLNEGKGEIEIADPGLAQGDQIQAAQYGFYIELIRYVQNIINGIVTDPITYPGISSAGVKVLVTYPRPLPAEPIQVSIQVEPGYTEADVSVLVVDAITQYLTDLQIGDDVVVAEIIERSMAVRGMYNIQVQAPKEDIVLAEDQILDLEDIDIIVS